MNQRPKRPDAYPSFLSFESICICKNEKVQFLPVISPHANNGTRHLLHRFISGNIKGREWLRQMPDPKAKWPSGNTKYMVLST